MNKLDTLYRAYKDYLKMIESSKEITSEINLISKDNEQEDVFEATKYLCIIEEDWVVAIEKGMEFIEKAVAEQRQFIRTNGEVVPIEKVKKVSRDSVEHLAKHSGLITHIPEDDSNIVPDQLYMVEKLSDFAVYENRFLYMLLSYLRDFIIFRLDKIEKLRMTYHCVVSFNKTYETKKRKLKYTVTLNDDREDNMYPISDDKSKAILKRINDVAQIVNSLLNTDLMIQVAKSPMIKPPIVKTNVLKMNNNFKNALALYDFVATYKGDGYTYKEVKTNFVPLKEVFGFEFATVPSLLTFISYNHGNNLEEILEHAYLEEERRIKEEEAKKLDEQLKKLKKRAADGGMSLEEYMLVLEKRLRMLEKDSEEIGLLHQEIEGLNRKISELNLEKAELNRKIEELNEVIEEKIKEIAYLNQKYIEDMEALKEAHALEIKQLNEEHENQINELNENHALEIDNLNKAHEEEINNINLANQDEIRRINEQHDEYINELNENHQAHIEEIKLKEAKERKSLFEQYENKNNELSDKLNTLEKTHKEMVADYDSKVSELKRNVESITGEKIKAVNEYETRIKKLEKDYTDSYNDLKLRSNAKIDELTYKANLIEGQMLASGVAKGDYAPGLDFSSQEKFEKLEAEFDAFNKFFKAQWKITKKEIRKQLLWTKEEKKQIKQETQNEANKIKEDSNKSEETTNDVKQ